MQITIQTFGVFRQFGRKILLDLEQNAKVSDIRKPLALALGDNNVGFDVVGLIESSRFATEDRILAENALLKSDVLITILPPVSGG